MVADFGLIATESFVLEAWVREREELIWPVSKEGLMSCILSRPPCPWT